VGEEIVEDDRGPGSSEESRPGPPGEDGAVGKPDEPDGVHDHGRPRVDEASARTTVSPTFKPPDTTMLTSGPRVRNSTPAEERTRASA
jgi:hypothetical protein